MVRRLLAIKAVLSPLNPAALRRDAVARRSTGRFSQLCNVRNLCCVKPFHCRNRRRPEMNSIVWLVGAVVIVIAVLNLVGFA
jgi:hypothetical protein